MIGLTRKQRELYDFIAARIRESGMAPTLREMQLAMGDSSTSHIHQMVSALIERGYIRRLHRRARAIEIVKRLEPDTAAVTLNAEILALTDRYAAAHGLTRDTAANELLRSALEAA